MINAQILSNNDKDNHLQKVVELFQKADGVWIATAFLKVSGLELLSKAIKDHIASDKPIQIIAGQNFGFSEPLALRTLRKMFLSKENATLFLDNANSNQSVFHPKLFAFRHHENVYLISGSANITKGGLVSNQELSVVLKTDVASAEWKEFIDYFSVITSCDNADIANLMIIKRYEKFYEEQRKARERQKVSPSKKAKDYSFDYTKLKKRLKSYNLESFNVAIKQRTIDYKKASKLLDEIIQTPRLTQKRFEQIIDHLVGKSGQPSLWKSGSLYRNRRKVYECKNEFRKLVKFIADNRKTSAENVFVNAKELVKLVDGAGINYVTEIMMTYQPDRFANLNKNPITVLDKEADVYYKAHSNSYNGDEYEEYCEVISEMCTELNLKNMLEADSFINDVYWELKEEEN